MESFAFLYLYIHSYTYIYIWCNGFMGTTFCYSCCLHSRKETSNEGRLTTSQNTGRAIILYEQTSHKTMYQYHLPIPHTHTQHHSRTHTRIVCFGYFFTHLWGGHSLKYCLEFISQRYLYIYIYTTCHIYFYMTNTTTTRNDCFVSFCLYKKDGHHCHGS